MYKIELFERFDKVYIYSSHGVKFLVELSVRFHNKRIIALARMKILLVCLRPDVVWANALNLVVVRIGVGAIFELCIIRLVKHMSLGASIRGSVSVRLA